MKPVKSVQRTRQSPRAGRPRVFRSAVDTWLYLVMFGAPLLVLGFALFAGGIDSLSDGLIVVGVVGLSLLVPVWLLMSTRYTVDGDTLHVRSGPVSRKIPLGDIRSVSPSRSILSAPALSLRRLSIRYGERGQVLISPADRTEFLRAIGFPSESA